MVVEHQASRSSIHSGVQERLGRVTRFSIFDLVGFTKEFCYFKMSNMGSRDFVRIPFLIW